MARPKRGEVPKGQVEYVAGRWTARVYVGTDRRTFALPYMSPEQREQAQARAAVLAELAAQLRAAGALDLAPKILSKAGVAADEEQLDKLRQVVARLAAGVTVPAGAKPGKPDTTFADVANDWTSGRLAERHPTTCASSAVPATTSSACATTFSRS